ncbi:hypothetical protein PWT90_07385 [Aphanocladium album]|nr:hypothetical protein PWT90_07385 [Aphanocladium album]
MSEPAARDERAPLLHSAEGTPESAENHGATTKNTSPLLQPSLLFFLLFMFVVELTEPFVDAPMMQIQEDIICRKHHPDIVSGADPRCKDTAVQSDLAFLTGWSSSLTLVPGLLTAVPYGYLGDKYGRAMILRLSIFGIVLWQLAMIVVCLFPQVFPIQMIWITPIFTLIGGGPSVYTASLFAIVSDVTPRQHITAAFSYFFAAAMAAGLLGSPLAYLAMRSSAWHSVAIGFGLFVFSLILSLALPGSWNTVHTKLARRDSEIDEPTSAPDVSPTTRTARFKAVIRDQFLANKTLGALFCSLFVIHLGRSCTGILKQYATHRYEWSWSEAGLLSMIISGVGIGSTVVVLPAIDYILRSKLSVNLFTKDLYLAQSCVGLMIFGLVAIGQASTSGSLLTGVVLFTLTSGDEAIMRSLLSQAADPETKGMVYTTAMVLETISALITGPTYAAIFRAGLLRGGYWLGLPFFLGAALIGLGGVFLYNVREKEPEQE